MLDTNDNASNDRVVEKPAPCRVTFFDEDRTGQGSSLHFNERGILVTCTDPVALNKKVKLVLLFPGFKNPLELQGEVVWTNIHGANDPLSPRGMGIKFLNIERDVERLLAELASQYEAFGSIYSCFYT